MPFQIPTLAELVQRTAHAFRSDLKGSDARLWPNNIAVSAKVIGGAIWEPFAFLDYISRMKFAHLAEGVWLDRHGAEYGMPRLVPSTASGQATIFGDAGVAVPAGLQLERADGIRYEITAGGIVSALGSVDVDVRALAAGRSGNAAPGVVLTLVTPTSRLEDEAEVATAGIGQGADLEGDEAYRARILHRKRMPPHGGAAHDYWQWVRDFNGAITRVFVDPVSATNGRTTVGVWFLMDETYPSGLPQGADVSAVVAYIDTVRPAGALVDIAAPVPVEIDVEISDLAPDTAAVRDAIRAELADMIRREGRVSTASRPFTLYRSLVSEAIAVATGEHHHTLVAPADDVDLTTGQVPVLGEVTFS